MERSIHHPQAGGAYLNKPKSLCIPLRYVVKFLAETNDAKPFAHGAGA
jgi:hypothetical protein